MYEHPYRKPMRYRGHDYHAPCCVHVTICTHARQWLFGTISAEGMFLNDAGQFVDASLRALHSEKDGVAIDTHMVMPDHVHAIMTLGTVPHADPDISISDLVQRFKMRVMKSWPKGIHTKGWMPYEAHLWQRSFYDALIENDRHLDATRNYILANPARWAERKEASS